jgi:hypothetical protein
MSYEFNLPRIPSQSENYQNHVVEKIRRMEQLVNPDEQLFVYCDASHERIRVQTIQFTDGSVILVHGEDSEGNPASVISTSFALELLCKIVKAKPEAKRAPIGFDGLK